MSIFENDRPEGYDEERDGESKLPHREKLAMSGKDIEDFVEHFGQEGEPLEGEAGAP